VVRNGLHNNRVTLIVVLMVATLFSNALEAVHHPIEASDDEEGESISYNDNKLTNNVRDVRVRLGDA
jgi:hypothetical protein